MVTLHQIHNSANIAETKELLRQTNKEIGAKQLEMAACLGAPKRWDELADESLLLGLRRSALIHRLTRQIEHAGRGEAEALE